MVRKLLKIAGYGGLVLVVLGIVAYLARDPLRDALAQTVSTRLSKSLNGSLHIGRLRGSLIASLVLQDIVLRDQQGVVAQLDEVRLTYDPLTLLKGRLTLSLVDIVRPRVTLVQEAGGAWNVTRIFPSTTSEDVPSPESSGAGAGLPLAVVLERLQIHHGHIALRTASLPGVQHVDAVQMRLHGQIDQRGLWIELQQFTARATPADVEIHTLRGAVQGLPGDLRVHDLRLQTGRSLITVNGALPGGTRPANLAVQMQPLDVTEIGRLLHNDALQGLLHLTLRAEGPPEALQVRAQLDTEGGQVDLKSRINMAATPLQYNGTLDITHLDLATLSASAAPQSDLNLRLHLKGHGITPGDLQGQVRLEIRPSHVANITLRPSRIELEAQQHRFLVRQCNLDTSVARLTATGAVDLQGTSDLQYRLVADLAQLRQLLDTHSLDGKIEIQGQLGGELTAISTRGTLQAQNVRYQENRLDDFRLTYEGSDLGTQPQARAHVEFRQARLGTLPIEQGNLQATYQGAERQARFVVEIRQSAEHGGNAKGSVVFAEAGQNIVLEDMQVRLANRIWRAEAPLEVAVGSGGIHLKQFRLVHANETLELSGALNGQNLQDLRLRATQIDLTALRPFVQLPDRVRGRASLQLHLTGTLTQPVLQSELTFWPELPKHLALHRVQTTLSYKHKRFQSAMRLKQGGREVLTLHLGLPVDLALTNVSLEQRLYEAPIALRMEIKRPDLAALRHWAPDLPGLSGRLHGTVSLQGTYAALDLNTSLRMQQVGVQGIVEHVSAPLELKARLVTAASLQELLRTLPRGGLTPRIQDLELRIPTLRGQLSGQERPSQPLQLDNVLMQAEGGLTEQGLQATIHTLRLQAEAFGFPRTDLTAAGRVTPQQFDLTRLQLQLPQSEVYLHGTLSRASQQLRLHVDIPHLRLDELARTLSPTIPSEIRGVVDLQGTMQAPHVQARLHYAGAAIAADATVRLQQPVPRYNATLRVNALEAAQFLPTVQGRLHAQLQLEGAGFTAEQRQAYLVLKIDSEGFSLLPGLTTALRAKLDGAAVHLEHLRLQSSPAALQASGTLSSTRQLALTYTLTLSDLQALGDTLGLDLQATGNVTGQVSGTLEALQTRGDVRLDTWSIAGFRGKGMHAAFTVANLPKTPRATLQQPQLAGTLSLTALRWQEQELGEVQVRFGMAGERLHTEILWQDQVQEILRVQGTFGMNPQGALALDVQVPSFDMTRLKPLSPAVLHSAGTLTLDLRLDGTLNQPHLQGVLVLHDGELQLAATGERYTDIQAQLVFDGDRVEIKRFDVGSRRGPLQLNGWIESAGFALRQLDLSMQADNFTAMHTPELEAVISAAIRAQGSLEEMTVAGNITVPEARFKLTDKLGGGPADIEPWELTVAGVYGPGREAVENPNGDARRTRKPVSLPFLRADVTLDIPKNAWVQGPGMAVELRGDMRVTKEFQEPFVLNGTIETIRGFASFYGKKFTLQEGQVTFPGTPEINPFVDVTVTHKVSDYVVTIEVGGKAKDPDITLSSVPELEQADIVSLLVIGKTTDRLTVSEQRSLTDRGQQVLGGVAAGQLQNLLGEPLGLDMVEIEAGEKLGTGRVGVGRYVTQDIFMTYEREVGGEGGNTVGVEYSINRRLKLKGSTSDVGGTAVDLFWRLDY